MNKSKKRLGWPVLKTLWTKEVTGSKDEKLPSDAAAAAARSCFRALALCPQSSATPPAWPASGSRGTRPASSPPAVDAEAPEDFRRRPRSVGKPEINRK